ncbi:hypothetical protein ACFL3S_06100 [Gemmatimonadota bacterium]
MPILIWGVLALAVGFIGLWVMARRAMPPAPPLPPDVELGATPLQRAARWGLGVGLFLAACAAVVIVWYGPETTYDDDNIRLAFTFLLLAVLVSLVVSTSWIVVRARRDKSLMDERDRAILDRAPAVQGIAVILTLAVWMIGLVEHFRPVGAIPTYYMYLVFWCCLLVHLMGLPLGILIGYRRR